MNEPIHIISLGAGVQSSTMALMAAHGEITPMPECAIFADTQAEPQSVYKWLDWLEKQLPFPVYRVTAGNLTKEALKVYKVKREGSKHPVGTPYMNRLIPLHGVNLDGTPGVLPRRCTYTFKVDQIIRKIRKIAPPKRGEDSVTVIQWIGISLDEVHRMKPSAHSWIEHRWPLIEKRIKRHDCLLWMNQHGYPKPPRSACYYCPYHSDTEWRRLKKEEPEEFAKAVKFDHAIRNLSKQFEHEIYREVFLHPSRKPLDQVDFSTDEDHGQQVMFGNECEGMCGV